MTEGDKCIVAIDPGLRNLAIWKGRSAGDPCQFLEKFDIKDDDAPYEAATNLLTREAGWLLDKDTISQVVIETQAPKNVPARIIATAIYGFYRGRGIPVSFSGSALKNAVIDKMAKELKIKLKPKPPVGTEHRIRLMHKINKENGIAVGRAALALVPRVYEKITETCVDPSTGKVKLDDVCDAYLLGVGKIFELAKKKKKPKSKKVKAQ